MWKCNKGRKYDSRTCPSQIASDPKVFGSFEILGGRAGVEMSESDKRKREVFILIILDPQSKPRN